MQKSHWQKSKKFSIAAVVLPVAERREFVEGVCRDEPELCREITSLVDSDCLEDSFLDEPVFTLGAKLLENDFSTLLDDQDFSFYKLQNSSVAAEWARFSSLVTSGSGAWLL
jgi:hypothetical protein